jgi:hypothetical protein
MQRTVWLVVVLIFATSSEARADKWVLGAEMGAAFTVERDDRVDAGGLFSIAVGRAFSLRDDLEISIHADFPMPPSISIQTPVALRWWPTNTGFTTHAAVRPILFLVNVCANDTDQCPMDDSLQPYERGGMAIGVLGAGGVGYAKGRFYSEVSYLAGWATGRDRQAGEEPLTGFYHGILFAGGARL